VTIVLLALFAMLALFCLEAAYWLMLAALLWVPAIICALGVLHLADIVGVPMQVAWVAASAVALGGRAAAGHIRDLLL
jgi:hypothetical protein